MKLTKEQKERLKAYPVLEEAVNHFIKYRGEPEEKGCIAHYTYFFKQKYLDNNVDPDEMFGWSNATSEDFWSWGSNSRWANTVACYIQSKFSKCLDIALDLADNYGDLNLTK